MTEEEWLTCADLTPMLEFLRGKASDRKLRLFAVACCRGTWETLYPADSRWAVEVAERYADGQVSQAKLAVAQRATIAAMPFTFRVVCSEYPVEAAEVTAHCRAGKVIYLRDIFGNPFRPVALDPTWLTPTVKAIAQQIYNEQTFERMPVLADSLEEAGCDSQNMLNHCRQPGVHVRGCWALDLVLGKE
jgi:hypothetical protein